MGQVETLQPVEENGRAGHVWKTFNLVSSKKSSRKLTISAENCNGKCIFLKSSAKYLACNGTKWNAMEFDVSF